MKAVALFVHFLIISSTSAFLNNGSVTPSKISNIPNQQPRSCRSYHGASSHYRNDGLLHLTSDGENAVSIRGGGGDATSFSPPIVAKLRAFLSMNFFLIGMAVVVSFAKIFPEVSIQES